MCDWFCRDGRGGGGHTLVMVSAVLGVDLRIDNLYIGPIEVVKASVSVESWVGILEVPEGLSHMVDRIADCVFTQSMKCGLRELGSADGVCKCGEDEDSVIATD